MTKSDFITCPECDGDGFKEDIDTRRIRYDSIDVPYVNVSCETCQGMGELEVEDKGISRFLTNREAA